MQTPLSAQKSQRSWDDAPALDRQHVKPATTTQHQRLLLNTLLRNHTVQGGYAVCLRTPP